MVIRRIFGDSFLDDILVIQEIFKLDMEYLSSVPFSLHSN